MHLKRLPTIGNLKQLLHATLCVELEFEALSIASQADPEADVIVYHVS